MDAIVNPLPNPNKGFYRKDRFYGKDIFPFTSIFLMKRQESGTPCCQRQSGQPIEKGVHNSLPMSDLQADGQIQ